MSDTERDTRDALCIVITTIALATLGLLAELNLLRAFLSDLREERADRRARVAWRHAQSRPHSIFKEPSMTSRAFTPAVLTTAIIASALAASPSQAEPTSAMAASNGSQPAATQTASSNSSSDATPSTPPQTVAVPERSGVALAFQANLDFTNAYFYHGIVQESAGLIVQPSARLTINFYQEDDLKIDGILGVWSSLHSERTLAQTQGDFAEYWYEADLIAGIAITNDKFTLTTAYTFLTSPSDAYETVQELDLTLAFDDSDLLGKFALHPYALLGIETGADASDGADSDAGTYLELGIAPGFTVDAGTTPLNFTFPCAVGLSLNNYYQYAAGNDDTFGFAQVGAKLSVPLPLGDRFGRWTLNAGAAGVFLGNHTSALNQGGDVEFVGTVGLQANF